MTEWMKVTLRYNVRVEDGETRQQVAKEGLDLLGASLKARRRHCCDPDVTIGDVEPARQEAVSRYDPRDEFERGAVEVFKATMRYMNAHDLAKHAFDAQLEILWPYLQAHRKAVADGEFVMPALVHSVVPTRHEVMAAIKNRLIYERDKHGVQEYPTSGELHKMAELAAEAAEKQYRHLWEK